ncbi:MAG: hypothetical protein ACPIOQ_48350, partial [Promethearchaeia archaeon]
MMHLQNNSPKQALRARQTETDRRRFSSIRRVGFLKRLGADYSTTHSVSSECSRGGGRNFLKELSSRN